VPAELVVDSESTSQKISDLLVPAGRIRYFAELDLGKLDYLPLVDAKIWLPFRSGLKPRSQVY
jgi:hypothetical protein